MLWQACRVLALLALSTLVAGAQTEVCTDFDDGTTQGWTAQAATVAVAVPGPDGSPYLACGDEASPPVSAIVAPLVFCGPWYDVESLEFDLIVSDDGWPGEAHALSPILHLKASPAENVGERAVFVVDAPVTDGDGAHPGWHHLIAPVHPVAGPDLPANEYGHWEVPQPLVDPVTDWNNLLGDVQLLRYIADIAGSPTQDERFGLDNVCLRFESPVAEQARCWSSLRAMWR